MSKRKRYGRTTDVLRKWNGYFILIAIVTSRTYMYNITQPAKEKKNPYKSRDHFLSDREYGRYVKTVLQPGMKVRARETYESVSMGDFGVYLQTNDGTPPAQVTWEGLGDAYWVYWHQVDLLPSEDEKKPADSSEWGHVCGKWAVIILKIMISVAMH